MWVDVDSNAKPTEIVPVVQHATINVDVWLKMQVMLGVHVKAKVSAIRENVYTIGEMDTVPRSAIQRFKSVEQDILIAPKHNDVKVFRD